MLDSVSLCCVGVAGESAFRAVRYERTPLAACPDYAPQQPFLLSGTASPSILEEKKPL